MKATTSVGMVIVSAILGFTLLGDQGVRQVSAQDGMPVADTNQVVSAEIMTPIAGVLPQEVDPSSAYAQLVRMVQSGVDSGVMLAYIQKSPRFFELDADDIIYLTNLGTPPEIIQAAMERDEQLMNEGIGIYNTPAVVDASEPAVESVSEPEQPVTINYFYDTLSPYGSWVNIDGYGRCWRPTAVLYDADWRPYLNNGSWVYTDHGWYWRSNYSWGWATFHYGRWFQDSRYGWCWWPDTVWAPSWVTWRYDSSYCGWAPLPPRTVYHSGVGLVYRGSVVSVGFGFGLNVSHYTYVETRYICNPKPWRYCVNRTDAQRIYERTRNHHDFATRDNGRTVINRGVSLSDLPEQTRRNIRPARLAYDGGRTGPGNDGELDSSTGTLHVRQPNRVGGSETVAARRTEVSGQRQGTAVQSAGAADRQENGVAISRNTQRGGAASSGRAAVQTPSGRTSANPAESSQSRTTGTAVAQQNRPATPPVTARANTGRAQSGQPRQNTAPAAVRPGNSQAGTSIPRSSTPATRTQSSVQAQTRTPSTVNRQTQPVQIPRTTSPAAGSRTTVTVPSRPAAPQTQQRNSQPQRATRPAPARVAPQRSSQVQTAPRPAPAPAPAAKPRPQPSQNSQRQAQPRVNQPSQPARAAQPAASARQNAPRANRQDNASGR